MGFQCVCVCVCERERGGEEGEGGKEVNTHTHTHTFSTLMALPSEPADQAPAWGSVSEKAALALL